MENKTSQFIVSVAVAAVVGALAAFVFVNVYQEYADNNLESISKQNAGNITIDRQQVQQGIETLRDEEAATIGVVQAVSPAVVSIAIYQEQRVAYNSTGDQYFDDFWFEVPPYAKPPSNGQQGSQKIQIGGGTGFVIRKDGLILTNRHVVDDENAEYRVVLSDDREFVAEVLAKDPVHDIALIKIDAENLPVAKLGDSDQNVIGQTVIAIGNALAEFDNTVTRGIISGVNRRVVAGDGRGSNEVIEEAIQTDAAINSGNSGGPLINLAGEVIGVNTAVSSLGQSIGFATPINVAKRAIESIEKYGRIVRPWLGVRYVIVTPEFAQQNQLSKEYGALIVAGAAGQNAVVPDSPAARAGLQEGDMVLEVNGQRIDTDTPLASVLSDYFPGDKVKLLIFRIGEERDIEVELGEFDI